MTEQQACTLCGAGGHLAAQCNWRSDSTLDKLRVSGLSIDGDNAYKRDLLDAVIGALAFGKQGSTPPPEGHWAWQFYEIGRAEAEERDRDRRIMQAMALDLGRVGEALGIPGMEQEGGADEFIDIIEEMKAGLVLSPQAWLDVQAERRRQVEAEGWTPQPMDRWPRRPAATRSMPAASTRTGRVAFGMALHCSGLGTKIGGSRAPHDAIWSRPAPLRWPRSNVSTGQAYRKVPSREPPRPLPEASPGWGENPNTQFWSRAIRLGGEALPMETPSEFLSKEELEAMIGAKSSKKQVEWLASHGWKYELNAAQRPVVGRIYARLRLAGVKPNGTVAVQEPWTLDLSKVS